MGQGHLLLRVLPADDEMTGRRQTVSARATRLLHVVLYGFGQRAVHHSAHVGLVHAQPEGHRGDDLVTAAAAVIDT